MSGLSRRLRRLEACCGGCPECGLFPDALFEGYEVLWDDTEDAEPVEPEFCATCGRQTVFVVGWGDIDLLESGHPDGIPGEGAT